MFRRSLAALSAVSLVAGLTLMATSPALADEAQPPASEAIEVVDTAAPPAPPLEEESAAPDSVATPTSDPETTEHSIVDGEKEADETEESAEDSDVQMEEPALASSARVASLAVATVNQQCSAYTSIVVDALADLDLTSTRSDGHNELQAGALRVWTGTAAGSPDPRKAAGYLDVPDVPLSSTGTVALGWTGTTPPPGGQIVVDLDGNGTRDGILVFEPSFYGQNLWLASIASGFDTTGAPTVPGGGGTINGSIDQYLATWPNAKILALGYSLGSGITGDGKLTLIQAGCYQVTFDLPRVTNQQCSTYTSIVVDDLADLDLSQTRSDGHNELQAGALRVWTGTATGSPDPRKAAGYLDVADVPLSSTGTVALGWTGTTPPPGGQIVVDLDGNGTRDGILVFEPSFYGQNLWLASITPGFATAGAPTVGGGGGTINGSIDQYLATWPNAKILALGYSLGSGVTGDGKLTLIQAGCYQVRFTLLPTLPFPDPSTPSTPSNGAGGTDQLDTLAVTGSTPSGAFGVGVLLLGAGAVLAGLAAVASRRRAARG